ncbi:hypothetical protein ACKWTF_012281 [Chironomus riparius]
MWIENRKCGVAIHNWNGKVTHGLGLDVGDFVEIFEENGSWWRGSCTRKPRSVGIFPKSYIHLKDPLKEDPVVAECTQVLREWSEIWKKLYVERETYKFITLRKVILSLLESRRELLSATLTQDQTLDLQMNVISKIDWGNRKLCLDLVPRVGPLAVNPPEVGIVALHNFHSSSDENTKNTSSRGTLRKKAPKKILTHHLYLCMRDFSYRVCEDAEIYFYIYDAHPSRQRQITERFLVRITKDGFSTYDVDMPHSNCTVFTDLGEAELNSDLYIVANVMRVGKIQFSDTSMRKSVDKSAMYQYYRRPYGIGVLPITDLRQFDCSLEPEERESTFKLYTCDEKDYYQLHELIIKKATGKFSPITATASNYGISVSMKLIYGGLGQAQIDQPLLFQGSNTRKMGFPDVVLPGDVRNDLFLTLDHGEFERGGKSTAKNIEVSVLVCDSAGGILSDCLSGGAGCENTMYYRSMIIYHNNSPSWNETLRLMVPIDKFANSHVRFEFRHCSTRDKSEPKMFGFSFARLMEHDGATIADGGHELFVYKCEDHSKLQGGHYLKLPCSVSDEQASPDVIPMFPRSSKETVFIKTLLCSTKLTQNGDLLALLQWRNHPEKIKDSLARVLRLKDEELVKFLQDVLDALFELFSTEDGNSTEHSGLVFHVLVSIFSLLKSNKFQHFKPVMDAYIENHFAAALVYKGLLSSVQHCAEWLTTSDRPEPIKKCFESIEYVFKLIIQSRKLFAEATGGQFEESFRRDLQMVFVSLDNMLSVPSSETTLPTQEAMLDAFGVVMELMENTLSPNEIGMLIKNLIDAIPRDSNPNLVKAKLRALKDLVSGKLFHSDDTRSIILTIACEHLSYHLSKRDELKLCSEMLGEILIHLNNLKNQKQENIDIELFELCRNILGVLTETVMLILTTSLNVLSSLITVLLGLLELMDEDHYKMVFDDLSINGETKDFLHRSLLVFKELLSQDIFPSDWLVMKMSANNIIKKALEEFAKPLVYRFLGSNSFDSQLWCSYFSLAVTFLTQPSLQLEQYHEVKRRKILNTYGDMRVSMGLQILSMWSQLGNHKLHFIPSMVGPFLEVTLVPEPALRKATLSVFYDMMQCEQSARGSFRLVESELIDKLDLLISENKGDDEYRELFSTMLNEHVEAENPPWRETGIAFINSVTQLLERLLDYRSVMQGDENRDKRMTCTVNLLNFYKTLNRKEMYLRYIYKLHELHVSSSNYIEAGFTLKLYADMLSWENDTLTFLPHEKHDSTGQPEWKRKEKLYQQIISYFDKGKYWEGGVPLCKELAQFYETKLYDYNKLSEILTTESKIFQNILTQIRPEPEYFRVFFIGKGFPLFVRNKQFVYRGLEYERIGAFTQRLQTEFSSAQLYTKNSPPDISIMNSNEQLFQISTVRPISDRNHLKNATNVVPEKISRFYEVNDVIRFQHDRPIHKGQFDKNNEFKSLWIERTTIDIAEQLPNILRWFEIRKQTLRELPPVEVACETLSNTLKELEDLINQYKLDNKRNLNPFTMRLKGTIDANVQGGIPKYQEAFLSEAYLTSAEGKDPIVQKLRTLIVNIIQILDSALELHGKLAPTEVQPLHKLLVERFNHFRDNLNCWGKVRRQKSESIINTPLPPLPTSIPRNDYDHDDTYSQIKSSNYNGYGSVNRKSLELPEIGSQPPPRPSKSSFEYVNSPEVPPKLIFKQNNAPPLPPRYTPDKRMSNPQYFDSPGEGPNVRRSQKLPYEIVDVYEDSSEIDFDVESDMVQRDSGISTNSQEVQNPYSASTNSLPMISGYHLPLRGHQKTSSNPEDFVRQKLRQVNSTDSIESNLAPALPPKNFMLQNYEDNESFTNSDSTSESLPLPPIPPIKQMHLPNGNCSTVPCCDYEINPDNLQPCCVPNRDENIDCEEVCYCDNPPPNQPCC